MGGMRTEESKSRISNFDNYLLNILNVLKPIKLNKALNDNANMYKEQKTKNKEKNQNTENNREIKVNFRKSYMEALKGNSKGDKESSKKEKSKGEESKMKEEKDRKVMGKIKRRERRNRIMKEKGKERKRKRWTNIKEIISWLSKINKKEIEERSGNFEFGNGINWLKNNPFSILVHEEIWTRKGNSENEYEFRTEIISIKSNRMKKGKEMKNNRMKIDTSGKVYNTLVMKMRKQGEIKRGVVKRKVEPFNFIHPCYNKRNICSQMSDVESTNSFDSGNSLKRSRQEKDTDEEMREISERSSVSNGLSRVAMEKREIELRKKEWEGASAKATELGLPEGLDKLGSIKAWAKVRWLDREGILLEGEEDFEVLKDQRSPKGKEPESRGEDEDDVVEVDGSRGQENIPPSPQNRTPLREITDRRIFVNTSQFTTVDDDQWEASNSSRASSSMSVRTNSSIGYDFRIVLNNRKWRRIKILEKENNKKGEYIIEKSKFNSKIKIINEHRNQVDEKTNKKNRRNMGVERILRRGTSSQATVRQDVGHLIDVLRARRVSCEDEMSYEQVRAAVAHVGIILEQDNYLNYFISVRGHGVLVAESIAHAELLETIDSEYIQCFRYEHIEGVRFLSIEVRGNIQEIPVRDLKRMVGKTLKARVLGGYFKLQQEGVVYLDFQNPRIFEKIEETKSLRVQDKNKNGFITMNFLRAGNRVTKDDKDRSVFFRFTVGLPDDVTKEELAKIGINKNKRKKKNIWNKESSILTNIIKVSTRSRFTTTGTLKREPDNPMESSCSTPRKKPALPRRYLVREMWEVEEQDSTRMMWKRGRRSESSGLETEWVEGLTETKMTGETKRTLRESLLEKFKWL